MTDEYKYLGFLESEKLLDTVQGLKTQELAQVCVLYFWKKNENEILHSDSEKNWSMILYFIDYKLFAIQISVRNIYLFKAVMH